MSETKEVKIIDLSSEEMSAALFLIKKKRVWGVSVFITMLILVIGIIITIEVMNLRISPIIVVPIIFVCSGSIAFCASPKCPKCKKPFYGFPLRFFWANSCMSCKTSYKDSSIAK